MSGVRVLVGTRKGAFTLEADGVRMHGPLIATLLLDLLRHAWPQAEVAQFEFRALRPLFDGQPFTVCGAPQADGKRVDLWAADQDGGLAMRAHAVIR